MNELANLKIGFVGCGKMAQAIIRGLLDSGRVKAGQVVASVSKENSENRVRLEEICVANTTCNGEVARNSQWIFLATKPTVVPTVLGELLKDESSLGPKQSKLLVSIVGGLSLGQLELLSKNAFRVARVMPNMPVAVRSGVSAYCVGSACQPQDSHMLNTLLSCIGTAVSLPESLFEPLTGLTGCGPAFIYPVIESMAEGAVKMGLPRQLALQLAAQTVQGASRMVLETQVHPAVLREDVESPGGSTIYGVHELEKAGVRNAFVNAVEASTRRSIEIGQSTVSN